MKQHYIKFSVISIFLLLFFTNENLLSAENSRTLTSVLVAPTVTTTAASSIASTSAILGGDVTADGGSTITQRGIVYSTTAMNTGDLIILGTDVTTNPNGTAATGTFLQYATGLIPGTTYYFRAYAINNDGTSYGAVTSFTTAAVPTVTTTAASSITSTSATIGGNVTADGGLAVTERGVVYSTTATTTGDLIVLGSGVTKIANGTAATGTFSQSVTGLSSGVTYYFRAYATNDNGTTYSYGDVTTFATVSAPTVTTTAASSIASTSATIGGNVTADGGLAVTERGVVYSTTAMNTGDLIVLGSGVTKIANGTATTGTFSQSVTGLSVGTIYYFRAYATNDNGTSYGYGDVTTFTTTGKTWSGGTTDWATAGNWTPSGVPTASDDVIIPDVPDKPVISAAGAVANNLTIEASSSLTIQGTGSLTVSVDLTVNTANSLTIESGGSLIVQNTSTGTVTYERNLATTNWYLISSPVSGETIQDILGVFDTSGSDIGLAPYDNSQAAANDQWSYYQSGATGSIVDGKGYSAKLASPPGNVPFSGTLNTSDVSIALTQGSGSGGNNFNLIGNPFTASINSGSFLTTNTSELSSETIWVWNQATSSYDTKITANGFKLAPAQGFFVEAGSTGNVTFSKTTQSHESTDTFQRQTAPEIKILVADESTSRYAEIYYYENATTGFDNGYDGELFGGEQNDFEIYSHLLTDNQNKKYQIQSLPDSNLESMVIPMGIKAGAGKEITFSLETLNLPTDLKVFLEDKEANIFTRLDEANTNYTVTLSEALDGVGRFYLHTSASALTVSSPTLSTVHIYQSDISTLRIVGLPQGNNAVKLYNVLGKQVLNTSFDDNAKDISLPKLAKGVYIAEIQTEVGQLNKKIILVE